jgi:histidinol-phosphate aminotransferase
MSNRPEARPGIMDIAAYVGGESHIPGVDRIIKLSSNEGPFGPSPLASKAHEAEATALHRYPDGGAAALRKAIAARYDLDAERIVCGAGSDELISLLCKAYAGVGDEVLYSKHGFLMYPITARSVGATPVTAEEIDKTANVDNLLAAVTDKTKIVFLANPNNPTGTYLPASEVKRLRDGLRGDILLVIDAAYAEYVTVDDYTPGIELVEATDNTVMTRTFSKIYALGGVRLGWAYAPAHIVDVLNRIRGPFNVGAAAMAAGVAAIGDKAFEEMSRTHNTKWLAWTTEQLTKLGLDVTESIGNFVLVCFDNAADRGAEGADAFLKSRGIVVRRMGGYGFPNCLRITIGLEDEMRAVVDALATYLGRNDPEQSA